MRLAPIFPGKLNGSHKPFDIHPKFITGFQPNAFLKTLLPSWDNSMSQYQMGLYLKLILGLPIPALLQDSPICPCRRRHDLLGSHSLNCKQNAGKAHIAAHEAVAKAVKRVFQRTGHKVVDNDPEMRARYFHLTTQKRGDLAILWDSEFQFLDPISRRPWTDAIADVKVVFLVNSHGTWTPAQSPHKDKIENPGLVQQEQIKNHKHTAFILQLVLLSFPL